MIRENTLANMAVAKSNKISNYLHGQHAILNKKDIDIKNGEVFHTSKTVLQSAKSVPVFHTNYLVGNPISLTSGDKEKVNLLQSIWKRGRFDNLLYNAVKAIMEYGNAYFYLYKEGGIIKGKLINNTCAYPQYIKGEYVEFIERYYDLISNIEFETLYTKTEVKEYENGILKNTYKNVSGLPIHMTSNDLDKSNIFGIGIIELLIPVMDSIEMLLNKAIDAVYTMSLAPLSVLKGQQIINESIDNDAVGVVLSIEDTADFSYCTANLDHASIQLILSQLLQQYYQIACIPNALYNGTISNVSETSLQILYSDCDSLSKKVQCSVSESVYQMLENIGKMVSVDFMDINVSFNISKPIDYNNLIDNLVKLNQMNAVSLETILRVSPYTNDVSEELKRLNKVSHDKLMDNQVEEDKGIEEE